MEKKIYYQFNDGEDSGNVIMELSGCMQWIASESTELKETDDLKQYTITPIWLTEEEFKNLPEVL